MILREKNYALDTDSNRAPPSVKRGVHGSSLCRGRNFSLSKSFKIIFTIIIIITTIIIIIIAPQVGGEGGGGEAGGAVGASAREAAERRSSSTSSSSAAAAAGRWRMAVCRGSTPPIPEASCPVAENWCYTQVITARNLSL